MAQTLRLRATSFAASAALLGLTVIAAMSVSITLQRIEFDGPPAVPVVRLDEPAPPPPPVAREHPPQAPAEDQVFTASALPPEPHAPPEDSLLAPAIPPGPPEIINPRWLRRPQNLASYYPRRALAHEITGEVLLDCRVLISGALDCAVVSETPSTWGFGRAALNMAADHRMAPATRDGLAVEGRYRMRVPFELR
ncbi:MAG: TonB family protein [Caulobacteraceae bacterium]